MTLVVGCQPTGTTWTDGINDNKVIMNSNTTSKVYIFDPPTTNNTYCKIGSYSVMNVTNSNLIHPTNGI